MSPFKIKLLIEKIKIIMFFLDSSRSHLILTVLVESRNLENNNLCFGKLGIVDLAGSERIAKSGVKGDALKEVNKLFIIMRFFNYYYIRICIF